MFDGVGGSLLFLQLRDNEMEVLRKATFPVSACG